MQLHTVVWGIDDSLSFVCLAASVDLGVDSLADGLEEASLESDEWVF